MSINLEVPLEMIDAGIASLSTGVNLLASSYLFLDSDDYNGATYTFEIVASNINTTINYTVNLYDVTGSAIKATITVPANTTNPKRFRSGSWTPTDATNRTYGVQLVQTAIDDQLKVFVARIIVTQVNATKTRIQIPLLGHGIISASNTITVDQTTSTTYTQGTPSHYSYYKKDSSVLSSISNWSLEAVLLNASPERTTYLGLFNATDGVQVTGAEISNPGTTPTLKSVELANDAVNFDNGDIFEARIKTSSTYQAQVARAALYCRLTSLVKAEIFWRVGRDVSGKSSATWPEGRILLDTSVLSNPTVYLEASAICADDAEIVFLRDHLTSDSGTDGSAVAGSGLNFNSASKVRIRSGALTVTDDDRFYVYKIASTNTLTLSNAWVIVDVYGLPPEITDQPDSQNLHYGNTLDLSVATSVPEVLTYQWYFNDDSHPISGATDDEYTKVSISDSDGGKYYCKVTNDAGTTGSNHAVIQIYPKVLIQPDDTIVLKGQLANFSVTAVGFPSISSYQWYKGDQILAGKTEEELEFYCDYADAGTYKCYVDNGVGEAVSSDSATLTVVDNPWRYNLFKLQSDVDRS